MKKIVWLKEFFLLITRIAGITYDFVKCLWAIRNLKGPIITVLGGLRVEKENIFSQEAFELAKILALEGFSIITGGGSGIMVSANCGAASVSAGSTVGIGLKILDKGFTNPCAHVYKPQYFFVRKFFLFNYSSGFVFFPGGIGTVDELFELLNIIAFNRYNNKIVILIGKDYWQPLIDWYVQTAMKKNLIDLAPYEAFIISDSITQAAQTIIKNCTTH